MNISDIRIRLIKRDETKFRAVADGKGPEFRPYASRAVARLVGG